MGDYNRKLTQSELKRKEKFESVCTDLEQQGYMKHDLTVDVVTASKMALVVMLPFVAIAVAVYFISVGKQGLNFQFVDLLWFLLATVVSVVMHELLHGVTWAMFSRSFRPISFGVIWSALTPYCTCSKPLKKWQYIVGALVPTIVLGVGLTVLSVLTAKMWIVLLNVTMIIGGGGDFYMVLKMLKCKFDGEVLYYDHPYECGVVAFVRNKQ